MPAVAFGKVVPSQIYKGAVLIQSVDYGQGKRVYVVTSEPGPEVYVPASCVPGVDDLSGNWPYFEKRVMRNPHIRMDFEADTYRPLRDGAYIKDGTSPNPFTFSLERGEVAQRQYDVVDPSTVKIEGEHLWITG